jgi:hypothetical protein
MTKREELEKALRKMIQIQRVANCLPSSGEISARFILLSVRGVVLAQWSVGISFSAG